MKNCTSCGAPVKGSCKVCPYCQTVLQDESGEGIAASETKAAEYPMRWHKFILVILILGAVYNFLNGILTLVGGKIRTIRGLADAAEYYARYPGLRACFMFSAVVSIAMGVFSIIVWKRLKEHRANGPISLKVLYVLGIVISMINLSWTSTILNTNLFNASNCAGMIGCVVYLIINSSYYAKRSELFVN